jgi:hypothetical protein
VPGQGGMTTTMTTMCQTLRRTSRLPPRPNRSFYPLALLCLLIFCVGGGDGKAGVAGMGWWHVSVRPRRICKYSYCLFLVAAAAEPRNWMCASPPARNPADFCNLGLDRRVKV